jgi:hypothetical protein
MAHEAPGCVLISHRPGELAAAGLCRRVRPRHLQAREKSRYRGRNRRGVLVQEAGHKQFKTHTSPLEALLSQTRARREGPGLGSLQREVQKPGGKTSWPIHLTNYNHRNKGIFSISLWPLSRKSGDAFPLTGRAWFLYNEIKNLQYK